MDYKKYLKTFWALPITYKIAGLVILLLILNPNSKIATGLFLCLVVYGFIKFLFGEGDDDFEQEGFRRGSKLVPARQLQKMIIKSKAPVGIDLGYIPIPIKNEVLQFLFCGGMGVGKSLAFDQVYKHARDRKHKAILVDLNGAATSKYYRPEKDIILNPFDSRSSNWSPLSEIEGEWQVEALAKSFIADGEGSAAEWNGYAQNLVSAVISSLLESGRTSNSDLYQKLCIPNMDELQELVAGTPAQNAITKDAKGMTASILSIIGSKFSALRFLNKDADKSNSFSIRKWMAKDDDSWIFINVRDDQLEALKPLIVAWLDIAISALLSLKEIQPNSTKRVWFGLDEMASLGRIQSINSLLTKSRKFGGVTVAGLQSISQLNSSYGMYDATTLLANFGNQIIFRQNDSLTAEHFAKTLGSQEINRVVEGGSEGEKSSTSYSNQITQQQIVLASQLMNLENRQGYLNLAGSYPVSLIQIQLPEQSKKVAESFIAK
jgi:type IV secretory pathway TraG/TraD family ATPase VirD4